MTLMKGLAAFFCIAGVITLVVFACGADKYGARDTCGGEHLAPGQVCQTYLNGQQNGTFEGSVKRRIPTGWKETAFTGLSLLAISLCFFAIVVIRSPELRGPVRKAFSHMFDRDRVRWLAIEKIREGLQDGNEETRQSAAVRLGNIGGAHAVKPLITLLKDSDEVVRQHAAASLGQIGDKQAIEPLTVVLRDEKTSVRDAATEALGKINS